MLGRTDSLDSTLTSTLPLIRDETPSAAQRILARLTRAIRHGNCAG